MTESGIPTMLGLGHEFAVMGGSRRRKHTKTHRRKHGKSAARKSHKKRTLKHRGGSHSTHPYITAGGKRKMTHRRRKHGKSAARKSHKKRHSLRRRRHRGGKSPFCHDKGCIVMGGSKHKKTHRRKRGKTAARKSHKKRSTHRRRRSHRGGAGIMSVINKAVVPFSLYKLQKRMQDMTRKARKHMYKSKR